MSQILCNLGTHTLRSKDAAILILSLVESCGIRIETESTTLFQNSDDTTRLTSASWFHWKTSAVTNREIKHGHCLLMMKGDYGEHKNNDYGPLTLKYLFS